MMHVVCGKNGTDQTASDVCHCFMNPKKFEEMLATSPMMRSLGGVETRKYENCKDTDSWGTKPAAAASLREAMS